MTKGFFEVSKLFFERTTAMMKEDFDDECCLQGQSTNRSDKRALT